MTQTPDVLIAIYALIDPRTQCVRYIGSSVDPDRRLKAHIASGKNDEYLPDDPLRSWLRGLRRADMLPEMVILEIAPEADAEAAEARWIAAYRASDAELCNLRLSKIARPKIGTKHRSPSRIVRREHMPAAEIVAFRARHRLSQGALAQLLGIHYSTVSRWEAGNRPVPARVRLGLATVERALTTKDASAE